MTGRLAAERTARHFHEAYERMAPRFGYETREASAKPWEQVPQQNRALMTAVAAEVYADIAADALHQAARHVPSTGVPAWLRQRADDIAARMEVEQ